MSDEASNNWNRLAAGRHELLAVVDLSSTTDGPYVVEAAGVRLDFSRFPTFKLQVVHVFIKNSGQTSSGPEDGDKRPLTLPERVQDKVLLEETNIDQTGEPPTKDAKLITWGQLERNSFCKEKEKIVELEEEDYYLQLLFKTIDEDHKHKPDHIGKEVEKVGHIKKLRTTGEPAGS
ncbi:hypothetical protein BYT27DRAFT_7219741 [Phlegmacium glaucopus]|nr:hypothetical protein BYT27DRAFT_7219741 [Phlegmacium glaucopus]